jgi:hypothetical protein
MRGLKSLYFLLVFISFSVLGQAPERQFPNSSFDEQAPRISPDGKELYFTIARHPQNINGVRDPGDIWISSWNGERWSPPVHGGSQINNSDFNSVVGFLAGGRQLLLSGHFSVG